MEKLTALSCEEFVRVLSSAAPVPGGGGASALVGAIGMALGSMVGSLTTGKKKYAAVEEDIQRLLARSQTIQTELLALVMRDAEVFEPVAKAYGMPSATDAEKAQKQQVMEKVLREAALVPAEIMDQCIAALEVTAEFVQKGSALAVSDAGVSATACRAGLEGASLNVYINTKMMKDREFADRLNRETQEKVARGAKLAEEIFTNVTQKLINQ
ncbi:cyclodeaminase/cyclohydrolase family protein [Pygmaiobacter massiliensis]|uniref:cyclodeaminase/cyclohydrolase family protein n=1 Tax=Pygmaiobacter massiliensis TaxID=1917873 RepID=UPI002A7F46E8|nr:cyclodeaminase/cyclohydrolase family protein [Pygmaiobacter massiliensis]MDY4784122.1 cyclodeaminase/cyclohydrolase family protein [Pygmaiobacter massiliensis]